MKTIKPWLFITIITYFFCSILSKTWDIFKWTENNSNLFMLISIFALITIGLFNLLEDGKFK